MISFFVGLNFGIWIGIALFAMLAGRKRKRPKHVPMEIRVIDDKIHAGVSKADVEECRNSHLPGDCPLCGAN